MPPLALRAPAARGSVLVTHAMVGRRSVEEEEERGGGGLDVTGSENRYWERNEGVIRFIEELDSDIVCIQVL